MKKCLPLFILLLIPFFLTGCKEKTTETSETTVAAGITNGIEIYVSPTGSAYNPGTLSEPTMLAYAFTKIKPGGTIYALPGVYNFKVRISLSQSGEAGKMKTVRPYEEGGEFVLDYTEQGLSDAARGIQLDSDYWHFYGMTIRYAGDNGMLITGSNNVIENCIFHDNQDTGLQISRYSSAFDLPLDPRWPSHNLILNSTSYNNCDPDGEDADGFAPKLTCGAGNVFDGCISYNNVDDGWDFYTKDLRNAGQGAISPITLRNCVSFFNGFTIQREKNTAGEYILNNGKYVTYAFGTSASDGNGFKLGGDDVPVNHLVENCIAFGNFAQGFTDNSNPGTIAIKNSTSYNNGYGAVFEQLNSRIVYCLVNIQNESTGIVERVLTELDVSTAFAGRSNFDVARHDGSKASRYGDAIVSNNTFNSLLSINTITTNADRYRGTAMYSLFAGASGQYYIGARSAVATGANATIDLAGEKKTIDKSSIFLSTTMPDVFDYDLFNNIHTLFRDENHNIALGDFLKVNPASLVYTMGYNNACLGADLD